MSNIPAITDDSFEQEVVESSLPVLVDFWAEWCGPCKALAPIVEKVAQDYADKVKFVKLDVDSNTNIPPKFGVRGIPTLILFKDGQVAGSHVGLLSEVDLKAFLDNHL